MTDTEIPETFPTETPDGDAVTWSLHKDWNFDHDPRPDPDPATVEFRYRTWKGVVEGKDDLFMDEGEPNPDYVQPE